MPRRRIAVLLAAALAIAIAAIAVAALTSSSEDDGRDLDAEARQAEDRLIAQIKGGDTQACEPVSKKFETVLTKMLRPPAKQIEGLQAVRVRTRVMYWMVAGQVKGATGQPRTAVWVADDLTKRNRVFSVDKTALEVSRWAGAEKMGGDFITTDEYGYRAAKLCNEIALQK